MTIPGLEPAESLVVRSALLSVYDKTGLVSLVRVLHKTGVQLFATGGTYEHLKKNSLPVKEVAALTGYPPLLSGRVKTLHPKIFGGILYRRGHAQDEQDVQAHQMPPFDLVVVNLYPFVEACRRGGSQEELIEKIDIGGVSLLRAAAKNYLHVCVLSSAAQYEAFEEHLRKGTLSLELRRHYAAQAFHLTSGYDAEISRHFRH